MAESQAAAALQLAVLILDLTTLASVRVCCIVELERCKYPGRGEMMGALAERGSLD